MTLEPNRKDSALPLDALRRIDDLAARFEEEWGAGLNPRIEDYLEGVPEPERSRLFHELLLSELEMRKRSGATLDEAEYHARFPDFGEMIRTAVRDSHLDDLDSASPSEATPTRVGRYRILRKIGEGGMGAVYEAEQDNPRRTVALKVIRPSLISPRIVKRFAHEAQILGRLQHAGIAQIHDAGLADDGRPFFAMEFIRGLALDDYARRERLDASARLDLLARVCDAVQHAHDKGVIHRDLKPGNILIDETGQPKVLDFGVARATDADLRTTTLRTEAGQLLGTLRYMSPEQVVADPAAMDRRSDVYSLGVILYELLADRPPYDLEHLPVFEVARVIMTQEPPRLGIIDPRFRGDVETIVVKALEKEKARRYPSAGELASDIRRHLSHEPILAHPPSALYHLGKFARRNKALVGGLASVMLVSILGAIVSIFFAIRADRLAASAIEQKEKADFQTYRARLAAAAAALAGHDVTDAARQLREAPEGLRGWEWRHLNSRIDDSSAVYTVPAGRFPLLFAGPGGFRLGAVSSAELRLIDENRKESLVTNHSPPRRIHWVGETSAGLWIMEADEGNRFRLLDEGGRVLVRLQGPPNGASRVMAVSPDQRRLVIVWSLGPNAHECHLIETASGKSLGNLRSRPESPWSLAFSPDSRRVVGSYEDGMALIWDATTGAVMSTLGGATGHTSKVLGAAFHPDGSRVVTTSADGTVRQWDVATGQQVEPAYDRHVGEVVVAVYSPDGQWVASGGTDRTIRVWRAQGRQDVAILHGHTGSVTELKFRDDGRRLASASKDRGYGYAFDNTQRLWEVNPQAGLPVLRGHSSYVYPVAYSPDGQWLASGSWDQTVRLWDARTGEPCAVLPHPAVVWALAFSADGSSLATACHGDDQLRLWDVATGQLLKQFATPGGSTRFLAVRPDGARIAASTLGADGRLRMSLYETETGKVVYSTDGAVLAYSPDSKWLACYGTDPGTVVLMDATTYQVGAHHSGHESTIYAANFSADGRLIATCGTDRTVRIWDIGSGKGRVLTGHTDEVFAVAFHPDGTRLASAGRDRAVWLWDVAKGEEVARLQGHTAYVWSLAFSPDGTTLASGSGDGTVRLWDTDPFAKRHEVSRALAALRPEAERLVERLFQSRATAGEVAAALGADERLSELLRHAARQAVLRRATAK